MSAVASQNVIIAIQNQIPALGRDRFTIDQRVAEVARNQFRQNYTWNRLYSTCSSLVGLVSFAGFGVATYMSLSSPIVALGLAGTSFVLSKVWINTRNQEGYALQNALNARDENEIIRQLSLGANIYQKVWPVGEAAADLLPQLKGTPRTVIQFFAEAGFAKVVAYLAMLQPDLLERTQMATDTLPYAANKRTAQLLLDFGANINEAKDIFFFCCLRRDLELMRLFVEAGARLDAGIADYERWEIDLDRRAREFGENWYPGNNEGVSPSLHPHFKTPLERLLAPDFGPNGRIDSPFRNNPFLILEAMNLDPKVYQDKNSAEELYHSLNQAGVRVRLQWAQALFARL